MSRSLEHLFDRNVAWAQAKTCGDPHFFRRLAEQQMPRSLWIGCSDSRVTANDVLGLDPGPHLPSVEERDALPSIDHRVLDPNEAISTQRRQPLDAFAAMEPPSCCASESGREASPVMEMEP